MTRPALLLLLLASPLWAAPPEVPSAPIKCAVGKDTIVTVKVPEGKKGGYRAGFRPEACLFFRGYSPDESVMTFLVRPYEGGIHTAVFWTEGEVASSIVEIDAGDTPPVVVDPVKPDPTKPVEPSTKATAATYFILKGTPLNQEIVYALDKLNAQGIRATLALDNTKDGTGDIPDQYKVSLPAARQAGLPALVVMAGEKVMRVVKSPKNEADVIGAIAP